MPPFGPVVPKHHDRGPLCITASAIAARGVQAADPRARGSAAVHQHQLFQVSSSSSFLLLFSPNPNLLLATKRQPPAIPMPPSPTFHLSLSCIYGLALAGYSPILSTFAGSCQQRSNTTTSGTRQEDGRSLRCSKDCYAFRDMPLQARLHGDMPSRKHPHVFTEARLYGGVPSWRHETQTHRDTPSQRRPDRHTPMSKIQWQCVSWTVFGADGEKGQGLSSAGAWVPNAEARTSCPI